jgi:hypothetical protein
MWRLTSRFFFGIFAAAMFANAASVYLLHDVDADLIGKWNLAYWELTLEFLAFSTVVAICFFLATWIGTVAFGLRDVPANLKLGFVLGIVLTLIQYPAEFTVRKLTPAFADAFLLGYLLLSPLCCAAIILLNSRKRRRELTRDAGRTDEITIPEKTSQA